jgi:lipopolysaccharide transport system permease protein
MSAEFHAVQTALDPGALRLRAAFQIRNRSAAPWRAAEGFALGYHLFDAETGALMVDGARTPLDRDLAPGESCPAALELPLPPEDGRYQVFVSLMREGECWYYERGWPFLLLEADVRDGAARLLRVRKTTRGALRVERGLRSLARAFTYPAASIWRNRALIRAMVRRDILGRYRGSFGGAFWTILHPALLMLTYFFVFGLVLRSRVEGLPGRSGFALYFLAGMLPWLAFSEAVGRAPGVLHEHRNFIRKLVFAVETLPVNLVVSGLVTELFALGLFGALLVVIHGAAPAIVWLPLLLIPQILFTAGVAWFLAALGVFVRDLSQLTGFLLTVWFFLTPICYPEASLASLPHSVTLILSKNPLYVLARGYRAVLLHNQPPAFSSLWKLWLLAAAVFLLGHAVFHKLRRSFADVI